MAEIQRHRADGADRVDAQLDTQAMAQRTQGVEIVQNAGRSLAMHEPEPATRGGSDETPFDFLDVEWFAPGFGQDLEAKPPAASMAHESLAEFSVGQDETGRAIQRQLTGNRIVGHRAAAEHDLGARGTGELAE